MSHTYTVHFPLFFVFGFFDGNNSKYTYQSNMRIIKKKKKQDKTERRRRLVTGYCQLVTQLSFNPTQHGLTQLTTTPSFARVCKTCISFGSNAGTTDNDPANSKHWKPSNHPTSTLLKVTDRSHYIINYQRLYRPARLEAYYILLLKSKLLCKVFQFCGVINKSYLEGTINIIRNILFTHVYTYQLFILQVRIF